MISFVKRNRKLSFLPLVIAVVMASLIFWREFELRDQIGFHKVILWQLVVWTPWVFGFFVLDFFQQKTKGLRHRDLALLGLSAITVALHFGWFFVISAFFSPYLGQDGCRFGVFRYFFVFWTFIDIVLVWFVTDKFMNTPMPDKKLPLRIKLARGNTTVFCETHQIYYLVSENYYTKLFTSEGIFVMRKPLKYFENVLPLDVFKKIHRSTIINLNYVLELKKGSGYTLDVVLKDGSSRRVSRKLIKEVTHLIKTRSF
ncbi:LytTR family DNA-binding domain-containing protein [Eudoraea chungangensis]|uniref:LytTR family DNA-binding domain-containing protein n=1 Tax=Eudoraea chungangensis TaxID=1481905 RepID=UPI0023EC7B30